MTKTNSSSRVLRLACGLAIAVLSTLLVPTTSRAQPPETTFNAEIVTREWAQLRDETELLEIRDPRAAIARYQKFYESRARLLPATAIAVASLISGVFQTARFLWLDRRAPVRQQDQRRADQA